MNGKNMDKWNRLVYLCGETAADFLSFFITFIISSSMYGWKGKIQIGRKKLSHFWVLQELFINVFQSRSCKHVNSTVQSFYSYRLNWGTTYIYGNAHLKRTIKWILVSLRSCATTIIQPRALSLLWEGPPCLAVVPAAWSPSLRHPLAPLFLYLGLLCTGHIKGHTQWVLEPGFVHLARFWGSSTVACMGHTLSLPITERYPLGGYTSVNV